MGLRLCNWMTLPIRLTASLLFVLLVSLPYDVSTQAQHPDDRMSAVTMGHAHEDAHRHAPAGGSAGTWEGSAAGKAYSEFNHHLAGIFVLIMGLTELRAALGIGALSWTRFLLPVAMVLAGSFLIGWSDHEAWPIGALTFAQTFFGSDWEIVQHKLFGALLWGVGAVETWRRLGRLTHPAWRVPLPALAVVGGLSLFLHSHGAHPAAHKIAVHHAVMGAMAVTAGSSKLAATWHSNRSSRVARWELLWSAFVILIGTQLLIYSE